VDHTNANAPLVAAWCGGLFARTAELIRHTTPAGFWPDESIVAFEAFLNNKYLPLLWNGRPTTAGGNWELAMAETVIQIGVFTSNSATVSQGVYLWRRRIPAYLYLKSDGALPVKPPLPNGKVMPDENVIPFWWNQATLVDGLSQVPSFPS